jgi:cysteinyl-tRNA synthetase
MTASVLTLHGQPLPVVGTARMYVCGITPYDVTHLGHAATFIWADLAARVLRQTGTPVELCRNVTDVDEDLLATARRIGTYYDHLAARQRFSFDHTMRRLHVKAPDIEPTARAFVPQVVRLAELLLSAGRAYERAGTVYFRGTDVHTSTGLSREEALRLARDGGTHLDDPAKEDPLDAVVWQAADDDVSWPSPWGPGRPGWHAECTAMALSAFGSSLDLHVGGADLRYPHHAFEAAQAEAVTGVRPFARAWLHVGTVGYSGAKIAKSTGNLVLVDDLLNDHEPAAIRLMVLGRRATDEWEFSPAVLRAAEERLDRLYAAAGTRAGGEKAASAVTAALLDDLDVPRALDLAEEEGGAAARLTVDTLALA